jgi:hypothetical protein
MYVPGARDRQDSSNAVDVSARELKKVHRFPVLDKHRTDEAAHHRPMRLSLPLGLRSTTSDSEALKFTRWLQGT